MLTFPQIAALYVPDPGEHLRIAAGRGLVCPPDVFEQIFHEPHADPIFAAAVQSIDWLPVRWREAELSGGALEQVHIPRDYERAVEEARADVIAEGLTDERAAVVAHWGSHQSWFRLPILVTGDVVGRPVAYELLVGFTRLGNLLGLIDRREVPRQKRHRVWIGSATV